MPPSPLGASAIVNQDDGGRLAFAKTGGVKHRLFGVLVIFLGCFALRLERRSLGVEGRSMVFAQRGCSSIHAPDRTVQRKCYSVVISLDSRGVRTVCKFS